MFLMNSAAGGGCSATGTHFVSNQHFCRSCPSHLFGHPSDSIKSKCISSSATMPRGEGALSCTFTRALSQSNFISPLARNEQSMGKWRCSRKNGLIVAGDELNKVVVHDSGVDPLNGKSKQHGDPILIIRVQSKEEDEKQSIHMSSELLGRSLSLSGNAIVAENYSSLEVGPNGLALICTERGCSPAYPSQTEYTANGKDIDRIEFEGNQGSFGADSDSRDVYYQKMLELNPGNSLLLTNYAKFLHEVQQDVERAEEFYKRALEASPGDGEILSIYAKFIWDTHNDAAEAEVYFRKAVEVASEDCYVVASYAHFLWNSEDDDEEEEEENNPSVTSLTSSTSGTTPA